MELVPGKGTSLKSDDWNTELNISLYDDILYVEIATGGTDKRGNTDGELLYRKEKKIKSESDIDKILNILKGKIKKFS